MLFSVVFNINLDDSISNIKLQFQLNKMNYGPFNRTHDR